MTYLLPLFAFVATIVAISKDSVSQDRSKIALMWSALFIALLTLIGSEWVLYTDKISAEEDKLELSKKLDESNSELITMRTQQSDQSIKIDHLLQEKDVLLGQLEQARLERRESLASLEKAMLEIKFLKKGQLDMVVTREADAKQARCESQLIKMQDFSLLVGLFRNGYKKHRYAEPTVHQVSTFNMLKSSGRFKGTEDEMMMSAMGEWRKDLYGKNPYVEFAKFHEMEDQIRNLGCKLLWKVDPNPGYTCECT
ncbi:MAG: hypothetical protein AB2689_28075 [Candidatus Thiodiazotropha taylori]